MLNQSELNKVVEEFDNLKKKIRQRKQELNKLNSQKEGWFKKKKDISTKIFSKISELKKSRTEVNSLDKEVTDLKNEKNSFSGDINNLIDEVKTLKQKYKDECSRSGITDSPGFIKKKIDKLEFVLETSALGFDQERRLNKDLKKLKKDYAQMSKVGKIWKLAADKERQISALKNKKFGTLDKLRQDNTQKYGLNEDFIVNSKEIMSLKKEQTEYYDKFLKLKEEFKQENDKLKSLLKQKDELSLVLTANDVKLKDEAKKIEADFIREKSAEVKQKIKNKKGKLTTEDLLIFQSANK